MDDMDRQKILIIDDEREVLDSLKGHLELEGYEICTAHDGEEGIAKAKTFKPNLVITDIRMPKKDGFEVLKELRGDPNNKRLPIIILSCVDDFDKIKEAYEGEVDFYVTKPIKLVILSKNIRTLLALAEIKK